MCPPVRAPRAFRTGLFAPEVRINYCRIRKRRYCAAVLVGKVGVGGGFVKEVEGRCAAPKSRSLNSESLRKSEKWKWLVYPQAQVE